MSLDMIGEWILILLDRKSGNIGRLLLRFCDENQSENFVSTVYGGTEKQNEALLCLVSKRHYRGQREPRADRGQYQLTPDPCEDFLHTTECCGEQGSVVGLC